MVNQVNPKRKRGRKGKTRVAEHEIIDLVFLVRYGANLDHLYQRKAPIWKPTAAGDFARCPGTVDGYRCAGDGSVKRVRGDCGVAEACRIAEQAFALKSEQHRWWDVSVHPETGEQQVYTRPPLIAKRKSEGLTSDGTATSLNNS